ncbi:MAG: hypothetical protein CMP67_10245 [Flavobacteriales bacterium]|nr:hypothetical protein [Flavobacteriales bacterium]
MQTLDFILDLNLKIQFSDNNGKVKNTSTEIIVRIWLHSKGFIFRLHDMSLPGRQDIFFRKYTTIIDVCCYFRLRHKKLLL